MRNSRQCPKCGGIHVARIEGDVKPDGSGHYIEIGLFKLALITRYVCLTCGFSEEYVENRSLQLIRKTYRPI